MNKDLILPIMILLTMLIIALIAFISEKNKRKKRFKEIIQNLDYKKNLLIGVPILSELSKVRELVKTDNLKEKLNEWDKEFKDIKEKQIDSLTDLITDADFSIDRNDYEEAVKKITNIEITIDMLKKKSTDLLESIRVITTSEERNRSIVTKLKVVYRELESKFDRTEKDYGPLIDNIKKELENLDKLFKKFEMCMDKNDYVSVEKIVIDLENRINSFKDYLDTTPSLVLISTILIPTKIDETKTYYFRMQRDGFPLDYLNIEYNIKEIKDKVDNVVGRLKNFEMDNCEIELKTILDYFNSIFITFDNEREAKDVFRESIKKLKKRLETINKVVYDIYKQMDDIKNTYDLSENEISKFNIINKELEKINEDYKVLFEHGKGRTFAYSKLVEELDGLSNRLTRLQDDLDYRLKSITSMKDDESRAKEQLNMIEQLLVQAKGKLKDYKIPLIPNSYFIELKEASEAIREIIKELDKKPIVIKILNIRVDTARDLVFKIYNKTNNIVKSVSLCEDLIVYGNRYRTESIEINDALNEATELFEKGKYKQSIDLSIKAIGTIDDSVYSHFELEK